MLHFEKHLKPQSYFSFKYIDTTDGKKKEHTELMSPQHSPKLRTEPEPRAELFSQGRVREQNQ